MPEEKDEKKKTSFMFQALAAGVIALALVWFLNMYMIREFQLALLLLLSAYVLSALFIEYGTRSLGVEDRDTVLMVYVCAAVVGLLLASALNGFDIRLIFRSFLLLVGAFLILPAVVYYARGWVRARG
ncbi:MAG: hypothetical protein AB1468_00510 [Candidatus Micrarchaeota archaeon]